MGFVLSGALAGSGSDVFVWGHGHVGDKNLNATQPTNIMLTGVKLLSLGGGYGTASHACALKVTGEIVCWGSDAYGQLGDGPDTADKVTPTAVLFP
jgi:alpha-tubulin suppressor-like RCC1 family protein